MKRIVLAFLIVSIVFCFVGCRKDEKTSDDKESLSTEVSQNEFYKSEEETFEIETPYCNLYYSAEWKDSVTVKNNDTDPYSVTFSTSLEGKEVSLFTIVFGENSDQGYSLGVLKTDDGDLRVYLVDHSGDISIDLSDDAKVIYDRMCEDVNIIISNLIYKNGLVLNG